jgi:hypothetical protein
MNEDEQKNLVEIAKDTMAFHLYDNDNRWFQPSRNPFEQGCCACGLYHKVKYRIDNDKIELFFERDDERTETLREYIRKHSEDFPDNLLSEITDLKAKLEKAEEFSKDWEMSIESQRCPKCRTNVGFRSPLGLYMQIQRLKDRAEKAEAHNLRLQSALTIALEDKEKAEARLKPIKEVKKLYSPSFGDGVLDKHLGKLDRAFLQAVTANLWQAIKQE